MTDFTFFFAYYHNQASEHMKMIYRNRHNTNLDSSRTKHILAATANKHIGTFPPRLVSYWAFIIGFGGSKSFHQWLGSRSTVVTKAVRRSSSIQSPQNYKLIERLLSSFIYLIFWFWFKQNKQTKQKLGKPQHLTRKKKKEAETTVLLEKRSHVHCWVCCSALKPIH